MSDDNKVSVLTIKHGSSEFKLDNLMTDHTVRYLKEQIEELTNVKIHRQRIFGLKHKDGSPVNDDLTLEDTNFVSGMKIMMMGSQEKDIQDIENASKLNQKSSRQPDDDFDIHEDDDGSDLRLHIDPDNMAKIQRRVEFYQIKTINEPRPGKKLLVLDIDYTLIDHRATVQQASDFARPYLHEFLTEAYKNYDIVIWSATSMRYIRAKMDELGVSSSYNYKITFYLDGAAMISVNSQKYGLLNVKPLAVIWGKFPGLYTPKNTIMFDDTRRNFLLNPQNGLKIKAYKESYKNRETDQELFHLTRYLNKIAQMDDLSTLDHKHWQRLVDAPKRHKSSKQ